MLKLLRSKRLVLVLIAMFAIIALVPGLMPVPAVGSGVEGMSVANVGNNIIAALGHDKFDRATTRIYNIASDTWSAPCCRWPSRQWCSDRWASWLARWRFGGAPGGGERRGSRGARWQGWLGITWLRGWSRKSRQQSVRQRLVRVGPSSLSLETVHTALQLGSVTFGCWPTP